MPTSAGAGGFGSSVFAHTGDGAGALHTGHGSHEQGWSEHGSVVSEAQQRTASQSRPHACRQPHAASGVSRLTHSASIHRTHRRNGRLGILGGLYLTCATGGGEWAPRRPRWVGDDAMCEEVC